VPGGNPKIVIAAEEEPGARPFQYYDDKQPQKFVSQSR
jgi:hypothetical protein